MTEQRDDLPITVINSDGTTTDHPSLTDFLDTMSANEDRANALLHERQRTMDWGAYWVRFYDIPHRVLIFGHAPEFHDLRAQTTATAVQHGDTMASVEREMRHYREMRGRGYLYSQCFSVLEPDGEWGDTHLSNVWPIGPSLFEHAREKRWAMDDFDPSYQFMLSEVFVGWRNHLAFLAEQTSRNGH